MHCHDELGSFDGYINIITFKEVKSIKMNMIACRNIFLCKG